MDCSDNLTQLAMKEMACNTFQMLYGLLVQFGKCGKNRKDTMVTLASEILQNSFCANSVKFMNVKYSFRKQY